MSKILRALWPEIFYIQKFMIIYMYTLRLYCYYYCYGNTEHKSLPINRKQTTRHSHMLEMNKWKRISEHINTKSFLPRRKIKLII